MEQYYYIWGMGMIPEELISKILSWYSYSDVVKICGERGADWAIKVYISQEKLDNIVDNNNLNMIEYATEYFFIAAEKFKKEAEKDGK